MMMSIRYDEQNKFEQFNLNSKLMNREMKRMEIYAYPLTGAWLKSKGCPCGVARTITELAFIICDDQPTGIRTGTMRYGLLN